jgi:hypothetical protein
MSTAPMRRNCASAARLGAFGGSPMGLPPAFRLCSSRHQFVQIFAMAL